MIILLLLKGVTKYLPSRKPRTSEHEHESIHHVDMTSEAPVWEPSENSFTKQEYIMTDFRGEVISNETIARGQRIIIYLSTGEEDAVDFTDDDILFNAFNAKFNVDMVRTSKGRHGVTSNSLSQKWLISPESARRTVQHTTQRGIRKILHLYLSCPFKKFNKC